MISGLFVWLGLAALLWWSVSSRVMSNHRSVTGDLLPALWTHAFAHHQRAELAPEESIWAAIGDPIFIIHPDGTFDQIGQVTALGEVTGLMAKMGAYTSKASAIFYPHAPLLRDGDSLVFYETPFSTSWIINTMVPAERKAAIIEDLRQTFESNSGEILAALKPIVEDTLREAMAAVESQLPQVLAKHEAKLAELGGKYQAQILEKKLLPLVKQEIFPMAVARAKPVATTIGQKLWDRVSVWRFGVRVLWDQNPLASGESVKREWERFLKEDAVPIVEAHSAELVAVLQDVVSDAAKNKKVQAVFRESIEQVVSDAELQRTIWLILREAVLENKLVHEVIDRQWRSPRAKAAFALTNNRLEPMIIRIGDMLMGTRETGISPELARVLRYRLLHKDSRFFVLERGGNAEAVAQVRGGSVLKMVVEVGGEPKVHPFVPVKKSE